MPIEKKETNDLDPGNYEGHIQLVTFNENDSKYNYVNVELAVETDHGTVTKSVGFNVTNGVIRRGDLGKLLRRFERWEQTSDFFETYDALADELNELLSGLHVSFTCVEDEMDSDFTKVVRESIQPIQRSLDGDVA